MTQHYVLSKLGGFPDCLEESITLCFIWTVIVIGKILAEASYKCAQADIALFTAAADNSIFLLLLESSCLAVCIRLVCMGDHYMQITIFANALEETPEVIIFMWVNIK